MKKAPENKMITPQKEVNKKISLLCIKECEMPGVGSWKSGQIVDCEATIQKIADNPNFVKHGEDK